MQQRVPTGIAGLDALLYGGFLEGDSVLVAGAPGTGKTSLGMQFLYNGIADYGDPGVFITFEEFPQQIYRDALNFGWDLRRLEEENKLKVLFTSPDLIQQDIQRHEGLVPEMIREIRAKRVVMDSISHFRRLTEDPAEFREVIYGVINALKREGLTSMLIRELAEGEALGQGGEDYVADAVVHLTRQTVEGSPMRFLQVSKSRGSRHRGGQSLFAITNEGLAVIPPYREAFFHLEAAASTGVSELDDLLGGGIPYGCFYLVELDSSVHEQLFDLNFLREAVTVDDVYMQITDQPSSREELLGMATQWEGRESLETAMERGAVQLLGIAGLEDGKPSKALPAAFESVCQRLPSGSKARLSINLSHLLLRMDEGSVLSVLSRLLELNRQYQGVSLGIINPTMVDQALCEKIRAAADGIVRVWSEGNYHYVQVRKTVNSVYTPVYAFLEIPSPPYMQILG